MLARNANALTVLDVQVVLVMYLALVVVELMVMELVMVALQEVEQVLQVVQETSRHHRSRNLWLEGLIICRPGSTVVFPHTCCECLLTAFQGSDVTYLVSMIPAHMQDAIVHRPPAR